MSSLIGQTLLRRYRLDAFVGRGGMADVYRAFDAHRQCDVAIKLLHEDLAEDRELVRRFRAEAQVLANLSHPNIVRFYEFGQDGPLAFLVMDYIAGNTLRRYLHDAGGPLALAAMRSIVQQVGAALAYVHREGVIHRDVKPGNIMLLPDGRPLLADFGIAKLADSATLTAAMPGAPAYMSPEQIRGHALDQRADIYSFGIVLYEMAAGRRPFVGEAAPEQSESTSVRVRWEHLNIAPPDPRQFNPALPPAVAQVILKALAKAPRQRWQSIDALLPAFDAACQAPERPLPPSPAPMLRPVTSSVMPAVPVVVHPHRNIAPWIIASLAFLALLIGVAALWSQPTGLVEATQITVAQQQTQLAQTQTLDAVQAQAASTIQAIATYTAQATSTARAQTEATTQAEATGTARAQAEATAQAKAAALARAQAEATAQAAAAAPTRAQTTDTARAQAEATQSTAKPPPPTPGAPSNMGLIVLQGSTSLAGLPTQVQWEGLPGIWHNVDNWYGPLDASGRINWEVWAKDFNTGPFRWIVYNVDGSTRFVSQSFWLPSAGKSYVIQVR